MTRKQIEKIAREHNVPDVFIRGNNKEELLRNVDRFWNGLFQYTIIRGDIKAQEEYKEKRDKLRDRLDYHPN